MQKLVLQDNGMIVLEETGDNFVRTSAAKGVTFTLEYKSVQGWQAISGHFEDEMTARQVLREANPRISWRLVAHKDGCKPLPIKKGWKGYY